MDSLIQIGIHTNMSWIRNTGLNVLTTFICRDTVNARLKNDIIVCSLASVILFLLHQSHVFAKTFPQLGTLYVILVKKIANFFKFCSLIFCVRIRIETSVILNTLLSVFGYNSITSTILLLSLPLKSALEEEKDVAYFITLHSL
jgi:hypothetical protein